jgi:hypothetical protein
VGLVLGCVCRHPNREPLWPALDQFFAATPGGGGSARLASLAFSPPPPPGVQQRKKNKLQKDFYTPFSYSLSQLGAVVRYIENQQKHHARKTFRAEYVQLLEKFGVDYDPRYIFKSGEE